MTFKALPDNEQIGDDFLLAFDEGTGLYAAVRSEDEEFPMKITGKSLWIVIAEAVYQYGQYLASKPETRLIPKWDDALKKVTWQ